MNNAELPGLKILSKINEPDYTLEAQRRTNVLAIGIGYEMRIFGGAEGYVEALVDRQVWKRLAQFAATQVLMFEKSACQELLDVIKLDQDVLDQFFEAQALKSGTKNKGVRRGS